MQSENGFLDLFIVLIAGATSLLAFSLLLPPSIASVVQELTGWGLVVALAGLALWRVYHLRDEFRDR